MDLHELVQGKWCRTPPRPFGASAVPKCAFRVLWIEGMKDMGLATNLSVRYINALRQLPQYHCNVVTTGPLTHPLTGVRVSPTGDLNDEADTVGILEVEFPGGHKIDVHAFAFFQIALKEAAEIEISTAPGGFGIPEANSRQYRNAFLT